MDQSSRSGAGAQQQQQQQQLGDHDVPVEVLQNIQSRLPLKASGRTSVLSKSWLHAWSTIPTLRFHHHSYPSFYHEPTLMKLKEDMDRTLTRYLRDNLPIETFELILEFEDQESACLAEKWIGDLATKNRVKELSLTINRSFISHDFAASFNLPLEILSNENLTKLNVITGSSWYTPTSATMNHHHPVIIKCSSLRELHLDGLHISQNILDAILSSCSSSLEKVQLSECCSGYLKTINVRNLPCLYELSIVTVDNDLDYSTDFVISHLLPNLHIFSLHVRSRRYIRPSFNAHLMSLAAGSSNLTQLSLEGVIMDTTSVDLMKSGFPFLESLSLDMTSWMLGSFHFTCASLKSVSLRSCPTRLVDLQIHAPKLCYFRFDGNTLPTTLLFPISTLSQLDLRLQIDMGAVDASFFLNMREALTLSRKCHLHIETYNSYQRPWDIDLINDLRTRLLLPPATNVQELWFKTDGDKCQWERSPFFDAFFEICHPNKVFAMPDRTFFEHNNHFCRLMLREVLENKNNTRPQTETVYWPHYLEHVQLKVVITEGLHDNWEPLTNSWRSLLDGSTPHVYMYFKLNWR